MNILQNIEPKKVFYYFEEISQIPRGSGNEKGISDYLVGVAQKLNLDVIQDKALNIVIKKPGTKGYENAPTVIIQGHMDMVCEKNKGTNHDFEKDPLKLRIKDDYIYATETTLGADNGIAIAYALALLDSNDIPHPPLEVLVTTDEETGMSGAMNIQAENINGKILLNLDSEEEGHLLVSCAGGNRTKISAPINWEQLNESQVTCVEILIRGLKGGHSGMEINKERGNSNKLLGRVLNDFLNKYEIRLISIDGGSKNNAIPREGDLRIAIINQNYNTIAKDIDTWKKVFLNELATQDPNVDLTISEITEPIIKVMDKESTERVVKMLYLIPNSINTMSMAIEGLVESSTNIGVVTTTEETVEFDSAVRSSIASLKEEIVLRCKCISELLGCNFEVTSDYPEWQYDPNSKIREVCQKVHKEMYGKEAEIVAIHAGVECGLFKEKLGELDMISFGPNLYDVHTPEEHMSISSVKNVWEYLKGILKAIK